MAVLIRTSDVPPAQRYDAWRSVVCDTLGPLDFRSDPDVPLSGEIEAGQLGPVNVGRVQTSTPHSVHRTLGLIRRGGSELYRVVLAMSGDLRLEQDGRAAQLRPGEFAIYDFARPYELAYDSAVQLAVFGFPRDLLALPPDSTSRLTAVPIAADQGTGALASPLLRRVVLDLETYRPASAARLCTVVMDLVTTAIAERADQAQALPAESRERTLLLRVHAFIEQHLGEAELWAPCRSAPWRPDGAFRTRRTSAGCSGELTGCRPPSTAATTSESVHGQSTGRRQFPRRVVCDFADCKRPHRASAGKEPADGNQAVRQSSGQGPQAVGGILHRPRL
jgi:AraC-binding-like domain